MSLSPIRVAQTIAKAAAASGTVATLLQQIMSQALALGVTTIPTIVEGVFTILETDFPSEDGLITALEVYLIGLLKPTPAPVVPAV